MAPPLVSFMVANHEVTSDLLKNLNQICVAAAPSGPELIKKFKEKAPNLVYREGTWKKESHAISQAGSQPLILKPHILNSFSSGWGMSETSPIALMTSLDDEVNGSCGVLVPNTEAKVIDVGSGKTLGSNQRGELCIRGPQVPSNFIWKTW